jgi:hypothetical protein
MFTWGLHPQDLVLDILISFGGYKPSPVVGSLNQGQLFHFSYIPNFIFHPRTVTDHFLSNPIFDCS